MRFPVQKAHIKAHKLFFWFVYANTLLSFFPSVHRKDLEKNCETNEKNGIFKFIYKGKIGSSYQMLG